MQRANFDMVACDMCRVKGGSVVECPLASSSSLMPPCSISRCRGLCTASAYPTWEGETPGKPALVITTAIGVSGGTRKSAGSRRTYLQETMPWGAISGLAEEPAGEFIQ